MYTFESNVIYTNFTQNERKTIAEPINTVGKKLQISPENSIENTNAGPLIVVIHRSYFSLDSFFFLHVLFMNSFTIETY